MPSQATKFCSEFARAQMEQIKDCLRSRGELLPDVINFLKVVLKKPTRQAAAQSHRRGIMKAREVAAIQSALGINLTVAAPVPTSLELRELDRQYASLIDPSQPIVGIYRSRLPFCGMTPQLLGVVAGQMKKMGNDYSDFLDQLLNYGDARRRFFLATSPPIPPQVYIEYSAWVKVLDKDKEVGLQNKDHRKLLQHLQASIAEKRVDIKTFMLEDDNDLNILPESIVNFGKRMLRFDNAYRPYLDDFRDLSIMRYAINKMSAVSSTPEIMKQLNEALGK